MASPEPPRRPPPPPPPSSPPTTTLLAGLNDRATVITTAIWLKQARNVPSDVRRCMELVEIVFRDARFLVELLQEHARAAPPPNRFMPPASDIRWQQQQRRRPEVELAIANANHTLAEFGLMLEAKARPVRGKNSSGGGGGRAIAVSVDDARALGSFSPQLELAHASLVTEIGHLQTYFAQTERQPRLGVNSRAELGGTGTALGKSSKSDDIVANHPDYQRAATPTTSSTFANVNLLRSVLGGPSVPVATPARYNPPSYGRTPVVPRAATLAPQPWSAPPPARVSGLGSLFAGSQSLGRQRSSAAPITAAPYPGQPRPPMANLPNFIPGGMPTRAATYGSATELPYRPLVREMPSQTSIRSGYGTPTPPPLPPPVAEVHGQTAAVFELADDVSARPRDIEEALQPPKDWPQVEFQQDDNHKFDWIGVAELPAELPADLKPTAALAELPVESEKMEKERVDGEQDKKDKKDERDEKDEKAATSPNSERASNTTSPSISFAVSSTSSTPVAVSSTSATPVDSASSALPPGYEKLTRVRRKPVGSSAVSSVGSMESLHSRVQPPSTIGEDESPPSRETSTKSIISTHSTRLP